MNITDKKKIIIKGVTEEGKPLRPSDWADRLSGQLSEFKGHRIRYDERLRPMTNQEGDRCLLVDTSLAYSNPELYKSILKFAEENKLPLCQPLENNNDENKAG
jgi:hypothetical protein